MMMMLVMTDRVFENSKMGLASGDESDDSKGNDDDLWYFKRPFSTMQMSAHSISSATYCAVKNICCSVLVPFPVTTISV
ncbi:unnamed protein product [Wuchereria bancrofti]|uniref:Uncharacterized protein n=1 Tax=Wuchereria bancrofti TaxID=6293 RepID=A0A3P7FJA9_WUCBA|nr:unnamed protein product [Wuchereria bancrofti]